MKRSVTALLGCFLASALVVTSLVTSPGCSGETVVVVNVKAPETLRPVDLLEITLSNAGQTFTDTFDVDGETFPLSFSVTPTGRKDQLDISIRAFSDSGDLQLVEGMGQASVTIKDGKRVTVDVTLEPADFLVNSTFTGEQTLTSASEPDSAGKQVAALPDGSFAITFLGDCAGASACDVFTRRFGADSLPTLNSQAGDDHELAVNDTTQTAPVGSPAVALGPNGQLVVWVEDGSSIRSTFVDATGKPLGKGVVIATASGASIKPHVAAFPDGTFVVVWRDEIAPSPAEATITGSFIDATGNPDIAGPFAISALPGQPYADPIVTPSGDGHGFAVAWHDGHNVFARFFDAAGAPLADEQNVTEHAASEVTYGPHIAWSGDAAMVVWGVSDSVGATTGKLVMRRFGRDVKGAPRQFFLPPNGRPGKPSLAARDDGNLAIVWHHCGLPGDGSGCGVYVQATRSTGLPIGDMLSGNTTTAGDQKDASIAAAGSGSFVAAWTDDSRAAPDDSNQAVRARMLPFDLDAGNGKLGAPCSGSGQVSCADGLICLAGSDQKPHCHEACSPGPGAMCPSGGICTGPAGGRGGCIF